MIKRETKANEPIQLFLANSTDPNLSDFVKSALSHPNGLTKREYFAAMAMQGIIANKDGLDIKIERDSIIPFINKNNAFSGGIFNLFLITYTN